MRDHFPGTIRARSSFLERRSTAAVQHARFVRTSQSKRHIANVDLAQLTSGSSVADSVIRTGATQHMTALRQLQEFSAFLNSDCVHFSSISTDVTLAKLTRHPMIRAQKGSLCADLQRRNTPRVHVLQRRIAHRTSKGQHHPAQVPAGFPMIARWAATRDQSVWCPDGFQPLEVS